MKTEAIRQAAERLRAQGHFGLASQVEEELSALEESHKEMTRALHSVLKVFPPFASDEEANAVNAAIDTLKQWAKS